MQCCAALSSAHLCSAATWCLAPAWLCCSELGCAVLLRFQAPLLNVLLLQGRRGMKMKRGRCRRLMLHSRVLRRFKACRYNNSCGTLTTFSIDTKDLVNRWPCGWSSNGTPAQCMLHQLSHGMFCAIDAGDNKRGFRMNAVCICLDDLLSVLSASRSKLQSSPAYSWQALQACVKAPNCAGQKKQCPCWRFGVSGGLTATACGLYHHGIHPGLCDQQQLECTGVTDSSTQVDSPMQEEEDKQQEAASNAPVPIGISGEVKSGQQLQVESGQEAGRHFRLHAKSPTGWQLDAQV